MNTVLIQRLAVLIPWGLVTFTLATSTGCPGKASRYGSSVGGTLTRKTVTKTKAAPRRAPPKPHWRDELARYNTISTLWNAINRHHDALGIALHPKVPTTTIIRPRPHPRPRLRLRPHHGTPPRPRVVPRPGATRRPPPPQPPRIYRPPVQARARAPQCRRVCNHVRAICYAAGRICRIAGRLRDYRARLICKRATARCADARRTALRRCRSCS